MIRVLLSLVLIFSLFLVACKKNDADVPNSDYVLKGLLCSDINSIRLGMVGRSDDSIRTDSLDLIVFPNPVDGLIAFNVRSREAHTTTFKYILTHALYPDAPDSILLKRNGSSVAYPVVVENNTLTGQEVVRATALLDGDTGWRYKGVVIKMAGQPKGFYRLFIETNTGTKLRMGLYKY